MRRILWSRIIFGFFSTHEFFLTPNWAFPILDPIEKLTLLCLLLEEGHNAARGINTSFDRDITGLGLYDQ